MLFVGLCQSKLFTPGVCNNEGFCCETGEIWVTGIHYKGVPKTPCPHILFPANVLQPPFW